MDFSYEIVGRRASHSSPSLFNQPSMSDFELLPKSKQDIVTKYIESLDSNETILDNLKTMKRILNTAFGAENNQITKPTEEQIITQLRMNGSGLPYITDTTDVEFERRIKSSRIGLTILVKFPKLTIVNSRKNKHDIKDLFVKINLRSDTTLDPSLLGIRTTLEKDEYFSGYLHSHLPHPTWNPYMFLRFCLGSGEITQVLALLANGFTEPNFTLFCIHLNNYVRWESIEGMPHKHIENIPAQGGSQVRGVIRQDVIRNAVNIIKPFIFSHENTGNWTREMMRFVIGPRGIEVQPTDEFEQWICTILSLTPPSDIERYRTNHDFLFSMKDTAGNYFALSTGQQRPIVHQITPLFRFKGEDQFLKVLDNESTIKTRRYPNPDITQELCSHLSRELTKTAITSKRAEIEEYSSADHGKVAEPDLFPL